MPASDMAGNGFVFIIFASFRNTEMLYIFESLLKIEREKFPNTFAKISDSILVKLQYKLILF